MTDSEICPACYGAEKPLCYRCLSKAKEKAETELAALQAERAVDIRYMDELKAELAIRGDMRCEDHPEVNAKTMWGCPDCIVFLRHEKGHLEAERDRLLAIMETIANNHDCDPRAEAREALDPMSHK